MNTAIAADDQARIETRYPAVFAPDWRSRSLKMLTVLAAIGLLVYGFTTLGMSWTRVFYGLGRLGQFVELMFPPTFGTYEKLQIYLLSLAQTLAIAFLGTLLAAVLALPLGLLAARNVIPNIFAHFALRRGLDVIRAIDTLIWALIWINVVGLGPFAGILAIATSDLGAFGKLFSEAVEVADKKPVEGILSSGGGKVEAVRYGILPQVTPIFLSQVLYFFESNARSSTIIGIVGAGGIGQHFSEQIMVLEWQHVAFLILLVLITVAVIDYVSARLRSAVIGKPPGSAQ
jgi:phosphonate transport system permease protein